MQKVYQNLNKKLGQAIATLSKIESKDFNQIICPHETGNFLIVHFGQGTEIDFNSLEDALFSMGVDKTAYNLDIYPGYPHAYLKTKNEENSQKITSYLFSRYQNMKSKTKLTIEHENEELMKKSLFWTFEGKERCIFFFNTLFQQEHLKCCSANNNLIPIATTDFSSLESIGLFIIPDVISQNEEKNMLDLIYTNKWENLSHRRVQHYGYKFIYGINSVNSEEKLIEIPNLFQKIFDNKVFEKVKKICKINKNDISNEDLSMYFDQMTVNEYKPGSGIPPHIDSHAPFEEMLVSVSLLSDIVMNLKNPTTNQEINFLLPAKSALVLTGEARYLWKHSIADRKIDKIENKFFFRRNRVSLTFRRLKKKPFCDCVFKTQCDFQKDKSLPIEETIDKQDPNFESIYVKDVYNSIAEHFSHTRYKPWPKVEEFLKSLPIHSLVGDIGCGNGKYIFCVDHLQFIGLDISQSFAQICRDKKRSTQVLVADSSAVPFRDNSLDHVISIAVIHHFSTDERRKAAINELIRIVKPGGKILIYVWAFEQGDKKFASQDVFVPWNNPKKFENAELSKVVDKKADLEKNTIVYKRFYHVFLKDELEKMIEEVKQENQWKIEIDKAYYDHENWCVEILKLN